jgi:cobyrinic acid a,c-diamide synthase
MQTIPRLVIAGTNSGVGKTSITLGLVSMLRRHGLRVQTFKAGPDYLDPMYLSMVSGRPCYNLDGWMTGRTYIEDLFSRKTADADIAVIEGVMGLFDGADSVTDEGSTAQIAKWLNAPVVLVVDVHGMARSVAAVVHGFSGFDPEVNVAGMIANKCGSHHHAQWLQESVESSSPVKMLGAVMHGGLPELSSRHLGLISAGPKTVSSDLTDKLAKALTPVLNMNGILQIARSVSPLMENIQKEETPALCCRLGVARDDAFHFYYPDNLEALEQAGCELVFFSPLGDQGLPEELDGIYLGGGYPEEHAAGLAANTSMLEQIRCFSGPIYAECGGLMYLAEGIETTNGDRYPQVGILPTWIKMKKQLRTLRYVEVTFSESTLWGRQGETLRGHEYHYSEMTSLPDWKTAYNVRPRMSDGIFFEGFFKESILASYIHLHFASRPDLANEFVRHLLILGPAPRNRKPEVKRYCTPTCKEDVW